MTFLSHLQLNIRRGYAKFYTKNHEWIEYVKATGQGPQSRSTVRVGISDYSQKALGDITFVDLPRASSQVSSNDPIAVVESVKGATDVYSPVDGIVMRVNAILQSKPSLVNRSPESDGWICELETELPEENIKKIHMLDRQYKQFCESE